MEGDGVADGVAEGSAEGDAVGDAGAVSVGSEVDGDAASLG